MNDFEDDADPPSQGWLATYADLMSLLMCFFVLLLSFSEMNINKYKEMAGSMKNAFGVQNKINVRQIPMGTSIISQAFSAGRPDPSQLNVIEQTVNKNDELSIDRWDIGRLSQAKTDEASRKTLMSDLKQLQDDTHKNLAILKNALHQQVAEGKVDVESSGMFIRVRIREAGLFASGEALMHEDMLKILRHIRHILPQVTGTISVEGHTDNLPINNQTFKSNWALSSARAVAVTQTLLKGKNIAKNRFMVVGYADTQPIAPQDTEQNRAKNRRVEIVLRQSIVTDDKTLAQVTN